MYVHNCPASIYVVASPYYFNIPEECSNKLTIRCNNKGTRDKSKHDKYKMVYNMLLPRNIGSYTIRRSNSTCGKPNIVVSLPDKKDLKSKRKRVAAHRGGKGSYVQIVRTSNGSKGPISVTHKESLE